MSDNEDQWCHNSIIENGARISKRMPRDGNGFTVGVYGDDEFNMLSECGMFADTGAHSSTFIYPMPYGGCDRVLKARGWIDKQGTPTEAGYMAMTRRTK